MKKLLGIVVLGLLLSGCGKPIDGIYNKKDSKFWTELYETETGGSILSHFYWGEKKDKLLKRADFRCKKINSNFVVTDFKTINRGSLAGDEMSHFEYECGKEKLKKKLNNNNSSLVSNNTLNKNFVCSYGGEKSKIEIRGSTATETTAIGISINYSIVNLSDKGAFSLQGSSKQDRAWFIGAQSFLLLGIEMIPYDCN